MTEAMQDYLDALDRYVDAKITLAQVEHQPSNSQQARLGHDQRYRVDMSRAGMADALASLLGEKAHIP